MAKYDEYIEIRPGYESVVGWKSDERNHNLWQEYVVHEDMRLTVDKICSSFKMEDPNQRRSFWIHGAYGTGKSYAAIVLKHLFTDTKENIERFFERKDKLIPLKIKFMSIRNKGDFLVIQKSGVTGITDGLSLMMEMEMAIRQALGDKFHEKAYYGRLSLVSEAKRIVTDKKYNWEEIFAASHYFKDDEYDEFEDFQKAVLAGDITACNIVANLCREYGWAMFASVDNFEDWVADVIKGNHLKDTGIIFLWDEFTDFIRHNGDNNVLQRLSEYCKKVPFFLFLIVHVDTSWVRNLGEETYERIMHRYHELPFHVSETAALDMIAEAIECKGGRREAWESLRKLYIKEIADQFDEVTVYKIKQEQQERLFPLHPMTLVMLTRVADNFAAASRTLFSFMKDADKAETSNVGFIHYIRNNGPYDWRWLTVDYLWDYFFLTGSDIREFGTEARRAYQLYEQKKDLVMGEDGTDYVLRVFKAALLLIAVMATDKKVFYSNRRRTVAKAEATRNTIRKCFVGLLPQDKVDECLQSLYNSNILFPVETLDKKDYRIELPYGQNVEKFDIRLEQIKKDNTRHNLFKKGGIFSKHIEEMLWSKQTDETYNRMSIAVCSEDTSSLNARFEEVRTEIEKAKYKLGLLCVVLSDSSHLAAAEQKIKTCIQEYPTERMSFCILKKPLTEEELEDWYRTKTHCELAQEDGKSNQYDEKMQLILSVWTAEALEGTISFYYQDRVYQSVYGKNDLKSRVREHILFHVFEAAPERIVGLQTVYKKAQESFALAGVVQNESPKLKLNAQMTSIADSLKMANVWECESIERLEQTTGTPAANAVAMLARKIHDNMTQGAKIKLDELWEELQAPPFGYYNAAICAYLLGFVLRFWKDSEFNWVDNESNSFELTDLYLAKMIQLICTDKAINHTLSSGSEIWHSFKEYLRVIFGFKENEISNEQKARYSLCAKITSYGVPLWSLKYIDAEQVGGETSKKVCDDALDGFFAFMQNRPGDDQEKNMDKVVQTFNGKGRQKKNLQEVLNTPNLRYEAFKEFIWKNSTEMKALTIQLKLTDNDLFDSIKKLMQANIETWTEEQVITKLPDLYREYQIICTLNYATGKEEKTLFRHVEMLRNCFSNMKVPGSIIEEMGYEWTDALSAMYSLTRTVWQSVSIDEKESMIAAISKNGRKAWQNICSSKVLMAGYIKSLGMECSETDLEQVYQAVREWSYDTKIPVYKEHIERPLEKIRDERNKKKLSSEWFSQTGFKTVEDWCEHYNVPIQWVIKKEALAYIECIHKVDTKKPVVPSEVYSALCYLQSEDLSYLRNERGIDDRFFEEIGERYREYFVEYKNDILTKIRVECGPTVYDWSKQGNRMMRVIHNFANRICEKKLKEKAICTINSLDERKLRETILGLVEEQPELCKYFAR